MNREEELRQRVTEPTYGSVIIVNVVSSSNSLWGVRQYDLNSDLQIGRMRKQARNLSSFGN